MLTAVVMGSAEAALAAVLWNVVSTLCLEHRTLSLLVQASVPAVQTAVYLYNSSYLYSMCFRPIYTTT